MDLELLGQRVRQLRLDGDLTLQGLADRCGVSVSMLSSIEHGDKAATVVLLDRIATGLGVRLVDLLTDETDRRFTVRRAAEQDVADEPGGWRRTILTPVVPGVNFELVRTSLPPGCDAGEFPAYAPGSHEFVVVDSGTLRLTVGDRTADLTSGDSVYFAADQPHRYLNPGRTVCGYYVAAIIMRPRGPAARLLRP
ncbi:helix-turn-helix transcriptional regulator [Plantactinospora sp. S1510]|uniref:Helix-turn-helix transcriptional regulator n=1 Tax=Plantactinospora alkalitolerans TaxID=2789879 RepID=A0ABS0H7T8_9ACTN|nr:XRE family transcriptional regulator [Plantactinospora alkalitolerans]MBF9134384.1 helix-turn-helix transcriptional regulator [Plantactinospora alkalitolerans]